MKKRRKLRKHLISNIASVIMLVLCGFLVFQLAKLDVLPFTYFIIIAALFVLWSLIVFFFHIKNKKHKFTQVISTILVIAMFFTTAFGNYIVAKVPNMLDKLTSLTDISEENISVYVMKDKKMKTIQDLDRSVLGTMENIDPIGTKEMMKSLKKEKINMQTKDYDSILEMVQALYDGKVSSIALNANYLELLNEYPAFKNFEKETRRVHAVEFTKGQALEIEKQNEFNTLIPKPFTIFISGNDQEGELSKDAIDESLRSDANILLTFNPKTGTILMTSVPRDYYLEIAADGYEGSYDKLTHTGLLGVGTTAKTIEESLGIDIDYVVRVNFSSMIQLVDAMGGIDIHVSEQIAEEAKGVVPESGTDLSEIHAGKCHLNGRQALDFSRERYCFTDGDVQRVRNQQTVMKAIIDKLMKPSTMLRYGKILDTIGDVVRTNMPSTLMKHIIRHVVVSRPSFEFEKYVLIGDFDNRYCTQLGSEASVVIPFEPSIETARLKIEAVKAGESSETVELQY